jgi:bifunctional enzyme CysN/CysC
VLDTSARTVSEAADEIEKMLTKTGVMFEEVVDLAANI